MSSRASNTQGDSQDRPSEISLIQITKSILDSGIHSDLILRCKGRDFKVHRCFIASGSEPLAAAIDGRFKESTTGVIDLEDDEPEIVEKMVQFIYTAQYQPTCAVYALPNPEKPSPATSSSQPPSENLLSASTNKSLICAVEIYIIADKYDIAGLKAFAKRDFECLLIMGTSTIDAFVTCLEMMYTKLPESDIDLKNAALERLGAENNIDKALGCTKFQEMCAKSGEVTLDIFRGVREFQKALGRSE